MVRAQEGSAPNVCGDPSIGMDATVAWQPETVAVATGPEFAPVIVTFSFTTGDVETLENSIELEPETQTAMACLAGSLDTSNAAPMEITPDCPLAMSTLPANEPPELSDWLYSIVVGLLT